MYLFLFLSLPCFLAVFFATAEDGEHCVAPCFFSFIVALAVCVIDEFFVFSVYRMTDSVLSNFFHLYIYDVLLICAPLTLIYLLCSKKSYVQKGRGVAFILLGFYVVHFPYSVITGAERFSLFLCFIKPFLLVSTVVTLSCAVTFMLKSVNERKYGLVFVWALAAFIFACLMPFVQTLWYMKELGVVWAGLAVLLVGLAVILSVSSHLVCKIRN